MNLFIITSSRADYGLLKPLIKRLNDDSFFDLKIIATGTHLSEAYGNTYREIENDGFSIFSVVSILENTDTPAALTKICANALSSFGNLYEKERPNAILVLGDRYEILCAVFAALFFKIPVIHYSGGEKTEGAYDDAIRHSITKMSHLHFVSAEEYRKRVIQLGEQPKTVFNVGSLGVDNIVNTQLLDKLQLQNSIGFSLDKPFFLISYHPETLSELSVERQFTEVLCALEDIKDYNLIFTKSNADTGGIKVSLMIDNYVSTHENAVAFDSLGMIRYLSAIKHSELVIGNSSSGLTEVPSFNKPTVNIGDRQKGRILADSVINTTVDAGEINKAIKLALTTGFKQKLKKHVSPFGDGTASEQIISVIKSFDFKAGTQKSFYDIDYK